MKVSVNFINQTTFLDVESSTTVSDLKKRIYEKFRVLTSMQSIVYEGTEIRGEASTLSDYEMKENACIILNLKKHVASSFDRKVLPVADRPMSLLKPEHSSENPTKKGHAGQLKSTRVRFDDSTSSSNTSLNDQQKVSNGNGDLINHSGDVNGIKSSAAVLVNSAGTPMKCVTHKFEASPFIENDVVVNEAYLTEDSNNKRAAIILSRSVHVDTVQEMKDALTEELYEDYAACSFYSSLCKHESLNQSLKYALKAHNILLAKSIAAQLTDLCYTPANKKETALGMRLRIYDLSSKIRRRYDTLADLTDVSSCCICMDALNNMTKLLIENQLDDAEEFSFCTVYPVLCKHELLTTNIKEALRARQIERARIFQTHLLALEFKPTQMQDGLSAADMKQRLCNIEERLKERYSSAAERADIEDSIYCTELMAKVQHLIIDGESAMAQAIFESEKDLMLVNQSESAGSQDDDQLHARLLFLKNGKDTVSKSPLKASSSSQGERNKLFSPSQSYISKYLAASNAALEKESTVLSGKWWLDEDDGKQ